MLDRLHQIGNGIIVSVLKAILRNYREYVDSALDRIGLTAKKLTSGSHSAQVHGMCGIYPEYDWTGTKKLTSRLKLLLQKQTPLAKGNHYNHYKLL